MAAPVLPLQALPRSAVALFAASAPVCLLLSLLGSCARKDVAISVREGAPIPIEAGTLPSGEARASHAAELGPTGARLSERGPDVDRVLLLTIDTFRADQPWTGSTRGDTPHLSELARRSTVFTRAYTMANLTTASLNGILAGKHPCELTHETCLFGRYDLAGSLAPVLASAKVATFGAHGHQIFASKAAPSVGFDEWLVVQGISSRFAEKGAVTGSEVADLVIEHVAQKEAKGKKSFIWAHFVDPHHVYVPHPEFPARGNSQRDLYDAEITYTDAAVGRILRALEDRHLAENTAVLVTADHGEAFGEHGAYRHGTTLHEEQVHIPLLLYVPGQSPRVVEEVRSSVDIAPTVAALLHVAPPPSWEGMSLTVDAEGPPGPSQTAVIERPEMMGGMIFAVVRGSKKVILEEPPHVFDLAADPGEQSPLKGDEADGLIEFARVEVGRLQRIKGMACGTGIASSAFGR